MKKKLKYCSSCKIIANQYGYRDMYGTFQPLIIQDPHHVPKFIIDSLKGRRIIFAVRLERFENELLCQSCYKRAVRRGAP
jgi:hypothetical protein